MEFQACRLKKLFEKLSESHKKVGKLDKIQSK